MKEYELNHKYLYFPIQPGYQETLIEIYREKIRESQKVTQFFIPVNWDYGQDYGASFYAPIPTSLLLDPSDGNHRITIKGDAPEGFFDAIFTSDELLLSQEKRPIIHFTSNSGWSNDGNGMVYSDGIYHMYYQYNPFDIKWNNMCWGHASSKDLLHWKIHELVMIPDEMGAIFSGSGIMNKHSLLGLPEDAIIYFYTKAGNANPWSQGKPFTQNIAFSTDQGRTLHKISKPCLNAIEKDSRDPKVFWHEDSQAYIMVLWIQGCQYGIFRSKDLENWTETQRLELEGTWECPDLFKVYTEEGESCWFFWSADGICSPGDFDGYHFSSYGETHRAYLAGKPYENGLPYAAQTFSNVENRLISIPWLRQPNDGRIYTGSYGIPVEFSLKVEDGKHYLIQKPISELMEQMQFISDGAGEYHNDGDKAMVAMIEVEEKLQCQINDTWIEYEVCSGKIMVGDKEYETEAGFHDIMIIVDDVIMEMFFDGGKRLGTFQLNRSGVDFQLQNESFKRCQIFDVK